VIEQREQNLVAGFELSSDRARESQRDRGHVLPEHNLVRRTVEQIRHRGAPSGNHFVGAAAGEKRSVGIRVRFEKIFVDGIHHLPGHLRSGRTVEKGRLLPIHFQMQRWKLFTNPADIERLGNRFMQSRCTHDCL
jgi:hypothetical protein